MNYPFECPNCKAKELITMSISSYKADGHMCRVCGTEMKREVNSLVCGLSIDRTNSFYRKLN